MMLSTTAARSLARSPEVIDIVFWPWNAFLLISAVTLALTLVSKLPVFEYASLNVRIMHCFPNTMVQFLDRIKTSIEY